MFKKAVSLISTIVMVVALGGCSSTKLQEVEGVTQLRFKDTIETSELKKIDSKTVSMIGFMSTSTPLKGEYTYLMNMPYQNCAFCVPNTDSLVNTIAVYAPEGKRFEFTDVPVKVTGTLEFAHTTDSMGYSYEYRIKDAKLEPADLSELEEDIKIYTALINQGFAESMEDIFTTIYKTINYEKKDIKAEELQVLDTNLTKDVKAMFENLDKSNYEEMISMTESIDKLITDINKDIESENYDNLGQYNNKENELYTTYSLWLLEAEI